MNATRTWQLTLFVLLALPFGGCSQLTLALHQPQFVPDTTPSRGRVRSHPRAVLAGLREPAPKQTEDRTSQEATPRPKNTEITSTKPSTVGTDKDDKTSAMPSYTVPGLPYQQLAMAAVGIVTASETTMADVEEIRRELVSSLAFSSTGQLGRLGLTAPPSQSAGRLVSRPGLQDGPATGLGFAVRDRNIFSAQANLLSGTNGRCHDLATAGFFGGSRPNCEHALRR